MKSGIPGDLILPAVPVPEQEVPVPALPVVVLRVGLVPQVPDPAPQAEVVLRGEPAQVPAVSMMRVVGKSYIILRKLNVATMRRLKSMIQAH